MLLEDFPLDSVTSDIGELEGVECLRGLEQLEVVNLEGNPVCELAEFRTHLLKILPHLRELNGRQLEEGIAQLQHFRV